MSGVDVSLRSRVPVPYMADGVMRYLDHGIQPGAFLTALFSGDLAAAQWKADEYNAAAMPEWIAFLRHVPNGAAGSPEKVAAWIERFRAARAADRPVVQHFRNGEIFL